jgi:hypothetical protein
MAEYRFLLADNVSKAFHALSRRRQRAALQAFERLAAHPVIEGLASVRDENGRVNYYKGDEGFIIKFWVDSAVREIRVVEIEKS